MASSIVSSVGKQMGSLLAQEAKHLYDVSDKIKNLHDELVWMQCFLEDADNREHKEKVLSLWVAEIRDFAYEAEDLVERYLHEVCHPRQKGVLNTIIWVLRVWGDVVALHNIGSGMDQLSTKISKMISRLQMYGIQIIKGPGSSTQNLALREQNRTYSHTELKTVGLKKHIEEVVDKLVKQEEANVLGIAGIGGLGKTTLARKVYSDKKVKQHFKKCVWVYLSKQFERTNIFWEILTGLGWSEKDNDGKERTLKDLTNEELPRKICKVLEEECCLVLLDDIWTNDDWDTLKPAFESIKRSRSKILITTRNMNLAQYADPSGYTHPFGILSDKDGWKLLQQAANMEENNRGADELKLEMDEMGKEMLKHCRGLPLAIVALGGILGTRKTLDGWKDVRKNISSYLSDTLMQEGGGAGVLSILEYSYDDLPYYLKPCFLYMGCFPEDYEISSNRLYHLWEAEGLVTTYSSGENNGVRLDDIAESYLNQLVNRSMVQVEKRWPNGSIDSCRLHDVMRDMCLSKCKEMNFLLNIASVGGSLEEQSSRCNAVCSSHMINRKLRRRIIHWEGDGERQSKEVPRINVVDPKEAPYIRSLLVFADENTYIFWKEGLSLDLRKGFSLLRALDLEGFVTINNGAMIRHGIHLRYLRLRGHHMPQFYGRPLCYKWECKYLETLNLLYMKSDQEIELSNEVWRLERLRHLYLPRRFVVVNSSDSTNNKLRLTLAQIRQLETLVSFDVEQCEIQDLEKLENIRIFAFKNESIQDKVVLGHLFKSPAIKNGRLKSPLHLSIHVNILKEDPTILSSPSLNSIFITELEMRGYFRDREEEAPAVDMMPMPTLEDNKDMDDLKLIFPRSLTKLYLHDWSIGKDDILELKIDNPGGGFKKLLDLTLRDMRDLEKWRSMARRRRDEQPRLCTLTAICM